MFRGSKDSNPVIQACEFQKKEDRGPYKGEKARQELDFVLGRIGKKGKQKKTKKRYDFVKARSNKTQR